MRRLRRWTLLALLAVFWSQAVYALHGACDVQPQAVAHLAAGMAEHSTQHHCGEAPRRDPDAACQSHCSPSSSSSEVARVPPVPAMLPLASAFPRLVPPPRAGDALTLDGDAPRVRPRGPTGHPAALLLI